MHTEVYSPMLDKLATLVLGAAWSHNVLIVAEEGLIRDRIHIALRSRGCRDIAQIDDPTVPYQAGIIAPEDLNEDVDQGYAVIVYVGMPPLLELDVHTVVLYDLGVG